MWPRDSERRPYRIGAVTVCGEAVSRGALRHAGRPFLETQSNEPMMRTPAVSGIGSLLVIFSSLISHGNQLWYKRRNILNHHESFPGQIIVAHSAIAIPEFVRELLPQRCAAIQNAG